MTHPRRRWSRLLALIAIAVIAVPILLPLRAAPAAAASYVPISGSGSTWSQNALDQWRKNVAQNYAMTVNYSGTGSSAGRRDFIDGKVDFAVSEIPFQANPEVGQPEVSTRPYAYMPIVAGGTSFMYNLKIGGRQVTNLRLSGETITKIFTNRITNWNDAAIKADNPGLAMPDRQITPVVRSDGSGSTAQFTLWMDTQHRDLWRSYSGLSGLTSQFPVQGAMKAQNGSLGVAGYVSQGYGEGAITYVEYSYAKNAKFPVAKVLNAAGYYIEPTAPSVAVAMLATQLNPDLTQNLQGVYNNPDPRTYPLSSYSYMILPTATGGVTNEAKGATLAAFANYFLCEGQQQAPQLGYSPLPMNLVLAGFDQIKRIPGQQVGNFDITKCNNPTFKPGDDVNKNQLALTAPQPAACDKRGGDQCTTGTAGAPAETAVTGSGNGGSSSDAGATAGGGTAPQAAAATSTDPGTAGTGTAVADAGAAAAGAPAVYDENGQVLTAATGSGTAVATPFELADAGWSIGNSLMVGAGGLLVLVIFLPPFMSRRLRGTSTKDGGGPGA